ncbi:MAG: CPBP family intramembrane glutamic endopeptidase [Verrucomicrobiales bacterium]
MQREPIHKRAFVQFVILAFTCIFSFIAGEMFLSGSGTIPLSARSLLAAAGVAVLAVGSNRLLKRQSGEEDALGIKFSAKAITGFSAGFAGGFLLVAVIGGCLWIFIPFHFERGTLLLSQVAPAATKFFLSNTGEELVFRGFLLLALVRAWGLRAGLATVALLFGLFHLFGLSGINAVKMVFTTASASFLFAAVFLWTRTLWTAVGLHVSMNLALHTVSGLDGGVAYFKPVLYSAYPQQYDPGFWIFLVAPVTIALVIFKRMEAKKQLTGAEIGLVSTDVPNFPD